MNDLFLPQHAPDAQPLLTVADRQDADGQPIARTEVSEGRLSHWLGTFIRRLKYVARFLYWTARHRSTEHVRWVLAAEGFTW